MTPSLNSFRGESDEIIWLLWKFANKRFFFETAGARRRTLIQQKIEMKSFPLLSAFIGG